MQNYRLTTVVAGAALMMCLAGCQVTEMFNSLFSPASQKNGSSSLAPAGMPLKPDEARAMDPNDPVVLKIDGSPVCTKSEFLDFASQAMAANPYLAQFGITSYETAPEPIKEQLFEAMLQSKLVVRYSNDQGIANQAEFQESLAKAMSQIKQALMMQLFDKKVLETIVVNGEEVTAKYQEVRERFVKEHGSVTAVGAKFTSEEKAKVFYHLVANTKEGSFDELAAEAGAQITDFGKVSRDPRLAMQSELPIPVRQAIFEVKGGQTFTQARDGDDDWVIQITDSVDPVYATLEEVEEQVREGVRGEKFRVAREERISEIRGQYMIDFDHTSLQSAQPEMSAMLEAMNQQVEDAEAKLDEHPVTASV